MAGGFRVTGANQFADLARDLRGAGNQALRRETQKALRKTATPLAKVAAPLAARAGLPKGGGLNEYVASSKFGVRTKVSARGVGVRIVGAKGKHDLAGMDRGRVRHLTYGRPPWQTQEIKPGWWTEGVSDSVVVPPVRKELLGVLDGVVRRIARG